VSLLRTTPQVIAGSSPTRSRSGWPARCRSVRVAATSTGSSSTRALELVDRPGDCDARVVVEHAGGVEPPEPVVAKRGQVNGLVDSSASAAA
jgi:hypothetical protein